MPKNVRSRVRLTSTVVERLATRERIYSVWDDEVRGLLVQVSPGGARSWLIDYVRRTDGRRERRKIGDASVLTPKEARDLARAHLGDVARGHNPFAEVDRARRAGTFREAAQTFLAAKEGIHADNTLKSRRTALMVHACAHFGARPLLAIAPDEVRRAHAKLARERAVTANRMVQAMRLVYRWAAESGLVLDGTDPTRGVKLAREPKQHRVFSVDEYQRIESALDDEAIDNPSALAACECLRFILLTGRRRDEVRTLRWADVDLEAGTMRAIATKTGRKSFAIPAPALDVLRRMRKRPVLSKHVFPSPVDPRNPVVNVNLVWDRVKVRAGIEGRARIHDMRHSFAGTATSLGMPIQAVAQLLGQDNPSSAARYAAAHADHSRELAGKVAGTIGAAMAGKGRSHGEA